MGYLTNEWISHVTPVSGAEIVAIKTQGWNYLKSLEARLAVTPKIFESYSTHDIAEALINCQKCDLDKSDNLKKNVLTPLYAAYDVRKNHAFRAWDFDRRAELMKAMLSITDLNEQLEVNRFETLVRLHHLHASVYGFEPDSIVQRVKPAATPRLSMASGEVINDYLISHGSRGRKEETIFINTFFPDRPSIPSKYYWADVSQISGLIFHEGRHAHQTKMTRDDQMMEYDEFRDIAVIMDLSTYGDYYLNNADQNVYKQNPSEKDAYDFQKDMEDFVRASPEMRKSLILQMEARRDAHLTMSRRQTKPQMALALAA